MITPRHDSELMLESTALKTAAHWSDLYGSYETVEKVQPPEGFPSEVCFYVTNRFDPHCNNKVAGYHPEL